MKKMIVTTTINSPTEATIKFLEKKDWQMVVVGDLKTPHGKYAELRSEYPNLQYLHPSTQEDLYKELSDAIGWNKIMRRNIGYLYAYQQGADIIASVDDDNIPYDNWGKDITVGKEVIVDCWKSENGVFDPLSVTNAEYLWHRGYPSELISTRHNIKIRFSRNIILLLIILPLGQFPINKTSIIQIMSQLKLLRTKNLFPFSIVNSF